MLHVPAVCDIELASLLRGLERGGLVSDERAAESLGLYLALPVHVHDVRSLLPRVWSLRQNFSAYDACYVALAEVLEASLLTADGGFARATADHTEVTVVGL